METMPFVYCQGCKRMLKFGKEDLIERGLRTNYTIYCFCNWEIGVPLDLALSLIDAVEKPDEDEKVLKAQRAKDALESTGGNKARAAQLLGVSTQTITNWLKYLPAEKASAETT
jgi:transcriptional regulator with GAF, ATPase, and Fis domain